MKVLKYGTASQAAGTEPSYRTVVVAGTHHNLLISNRKDLAYV